MIDGDEHAVRCNGVFDIDGDGRLLAVRDYVDLGEWRDRVGPVLTRRRSAPPGEVVARHLDAVDRLDVLAMAADYAHDAVLERAGRRHLAGAEPPQGLGPDPTGADRTDPGDDDPPAAHDGGRRTSEPMKPPRPTPISR